MLSKQRALTGWQVHFSRIIRASFNLNVIQCYTPTNEDVDKDQFYRRLQKILGTFPDRDIIIHMGDFNAKAGSDNRGN